MWRALRDGLLIRWCASLTLVATFAAPRLVGADEFGVAATIMALPYLLQGLCEPIIVTLVIDRWKTPQRSADLASLWNDSFAAGIAGALLIACFSSWYLPGGLSTYKAACAGLAVAFLSLAMVNTWLIGIGYALSEHSTLMRTYAASAAIQPVVLFLLRNGGAAAVLASLLASQIVVGLVLFGAREIRTAFFEIVAARSAVANRRGYLAAAAPRVSLLLLNTGTVMLAGVLYPPARVAAFRMSLGVAGALNYIVPISPQVLQSVLTDGDAAVRRTARRALMWTFAGMTALCAVLFCFSAEFLEFLLQRPASRWDGAMFLAMPCFLLIQPLSAYLYATGRGRVAFSSTCGCVLAFSAGVVLGGPQWAFAGGAVAYTAVSLSLVAWMTRSASGRSAESLQVVSGEVPAVHCRSTPPIRRTA